jgi:xylose isomerase
LSGPWFGWNAIMGAFFEVKLLEESGYNGPRNFASWPAGIDADGAFVVAAGCMRTYLALAAKARRFAEDPGIQEALADVGALELAEPSIGLYSRESAQDLAGQVIDPDKLAARSYRATHLNQLVTDLLLDLR